MTDRDPLTLLSDLIDKAKAAGADAADALCAEGTSLSIARRKGKLEQLERSEGVDLGLRVMVGQRAAVVSSSDRSEDALTALVERAVAMAKAAPEDPYGGLADADLLTAPGDGHDLEICAPGEPDPARLTDWVRACEDAALAVPGITNSEGAQAGWGRNKVALATSNGFSGQYEVSGYSLSVSVLAGSGTAMERDYDYATAVFAEDLDTPETIGRRAAERTLKRLNPRKIDSCNAPVIYDPRVSRGLLGHLASAINGAAIARKTSFLTEAMDSQLFAAGIDIIDDPHRRRGLASKPFDGEGLANPALKLVEDGVLRHWLLDLRSARQLGLASNGRAGRGTSSPPNPSTTNLHMAPGRLTPKELMADITGGLYVTELIGMGVNGVTGDYSRGAAGFWIENGDIAYPVSEITIAGNLKDMFAHLTPADDLVFRYGRNAPTVRIDPMAIAGR